MSTADLGAGFESPEDGGGIPDGPQRLRCEDIPGGVRGAAEVTPDGHVRKTEITDSSVDFPAPDGPITAMRLPAGAVQSAARRKSPCVMVRRSSCNTAASGVKDPEEGKGQGDKDQRGRGGGLHPVGAGQLADDKGERGLLFPCLLYTSPSPRDRTRSRMPSSA